MMVVAFSRSGPGVLNVSEPAPDVMRVADYARSPIDWNLKSEASTLFGLSFRIFRRRRYAMPREEGLEWEGWAGYDPPDGWLVLDIYVEEP
jgi:hypothetical protein